MEQSTSNPLFSSSKVVEDHRFLCKSKGPIWDFLLVISSKLGHLAPFMRYSDLYLAQNRQCFVPFSFNALD